MLRCIVYPFIAPITSITQLLREGSCQLGRLTSLLKQFRGMSVVIAKKKPRFFENGQLNTVESIIHTVVNGFELFLAKLI